MKPVILSEKTKYSISRAVAGVVVGAGASLLGFIVVTAYAAAIGVAVFVELGLIARPRWPQ